MKKVLLVIMAVMMLSGCTRYVQGTVLDLSIKRAPACQTTVTADGTPILEARAKKPCPKRD